MLFAVLIWPGILYLISLVSVSRWKLSTARSLFAVILSLVAAVLGLLFGYQAWMGADRSGDASATTAGALFAIFVAAPAAGLIVFWAVVGFSKLYVGVRRS